MTSNVCRDVGRIDLPWLELSPHRDLQFILTPLHDPARGPKRLILLLLAIRMSEGGAPEERRPNEIIISIKRDIPLRGCEVRAPGGELRTGGRLSSGERLCEGEQCCRRLGLLVVCVYLTLYLLIELDRYGRWRCSCVCRLVGVCNSRFPAVRIC